MRALPENIARGQSNDRACEVVADQGQELQHPHMEMFCRWLLG